MKRSSLSYKLRMIILFISLLSALLNHQVIFLYSSFYQLPLIGGEGGGRTHDIDDIDVYMTLPTITGTSATSIQRPKPLDQEKEETTTTTTTTSTLTAFDELQVKVFGQLQKESQPERNEYNMLTIRIKDVSVVAEDDDDKKEHAKAANRTPMADISTTDLNLFDLQNWKKGTGGLQNTDRVLLSQIYSKANSIFEFGLGESTYIAAHMQQQKNRNKSVVKATTDNSNNFTSSNNFMYYAGIDSDQNWVREAYSTVLESFTNNSKSNPYPTMTTSDTNPTKTITNVTLTTTMTTSADNSNVKSNGRKISSSPSSFFRFYSVDVGSTLMWGVPIAAVVTNNNGQNQNQQQLNNGYRYQLGPLSKEPNPFDVYYVDGRWRVGCVYASFLHASSKGASHNTTRVLLHDCRLINQTTWTGYHSYRKYGSANMLNDFDMIDHSKNLKSQGVGKGGRICVFQRKKGVSDETLLKHWWEIKDDFN